MSTTKDKQKAQNVADSDLLDRLLAEGGVEIKTDRAIYAAEKCGQVPLVGFPYDLMEMPTIDKGKKTQREWQAFVFVVTYKGVGLNRERQIEEVQEGEEVIVPATYQLLSAIKRFATDPSKLHEIGLQPKRKIDIGSGKSLWLYRVIATGKTKERGNVYTLSQPKPIPQLGTTADGTQFDTATGEVVTPAAAS